MSKCCFTGKRPKDLCGYTKTKYSGFHKELAKMIEGLYDLGVREFITGGAQGFDQLAFWAVNTAKSTHKDIKNVLYIPFKGYERRWADKGLFSQEEYKFMISLADEVKFITEEELVDYDEIVSALFMRNHEMVDASNICVALYPGDDWGEPRTGGTAETMRYTKERGKTLYQIKYNIDNEGLHTVSTKKI